MIRWMDKLAAKPGQKNTVLGRVQTPECPFNADTAHPDAFSRSLEVAGNTRQASAAPSTITTTAAASLCPTNPSDTAIRRP